MAGHSFRGSSLSEPSPSQIPKTGRATGGGGRTTSQPRSTSLSAQRPGASMRPQTARTERCENHLSLSRSVEASGPRPQSTGSIGLEPSLLNAAPLRNIGSGSPDPPRRSTSMQRSSRSVTASVSLSNGLAGATPYPSVSSTNSAARGSLAPKASVSLSNGFARYDTNSNHPILTEPMPPRKIAMLLEDPRKPTSAARLFASSPRRGCGGPAENSAPAPFGSSPVQLFDSSPQVQRTGSELTEPNRADVLQKPTCFAGGLPRRSLEQMNVSPLYRSTSGLLPPNMAGAGGTLRLGSGTSPRLLGASSGPGSPMRKSNSLPGSGVGSFQSDFSRFVETQSRLKIEGAMHAASMQWSPPPKAVGASVGLTPNSWA